MAREITSRGANLVDEPLAGASRMRARDPVGPPERRGRGWPVMGAAGRMDLHELDVGHGHSGSQGHGRPIAVASPG